MRPAALRGPLAFLVLAALAPAPSAAGELPDLRLERVADVPAPTFVTHAGDARLFITLQRGQVVILEDAQLRDAPFLDITDRVRFGGVRGLFSVAFHPGYPDNGLFFVNYTGHQGQSITARYEVSADDPDAARPETERVLLSVPQPFGNHNGGQLQFGPDGYLYAGMGDGGGLADPFCEAQSQASLLGKVLRLDVDRHADAPPFYAIPLDNPYRGPGDPPDEVWASGLRNPWRFSFDRATGEMYLADVGEEDREEVNLEPPGSGGGRNYGWKVMEGTTCFSTAGCPDDVPPCGSPAYTPPIFEYGHGEGECSIIGGYVYRGSEIPQLAGAYLYGDLCSGRLWAARRGEEGWTSEELPFRLPRLVSFGEDLEGELYLVAGDAVHRLRGPASPCAPGPDVLCLQGGRFRVTATWRTGSGRSGSGTAVPLSADSGTFWFFEADNAEVMVKLLDACGGRFDAFWFFAAGLTNVEVELVVTDTATGQERRYASPLDTPFQPIQDTRAFETCP